MGGDDGAFTLNEQDQEDLAKSIHSENNEPKRNNESQNEPEKKVWMTKLLWK